MLQIADFLQSRSTQFPRHYENLLLFSIDL